MIFHSDKSKNTQIENRVLSSRESWVRDLYPNEKLFVITRENFFLAGTLLKELGFSEERIQDFGVLPLGSIYDRFLDYLHQLRLQFPQELLVADTDLLCLLYSIQKSGLDQVDGLILLSCFSSQAFTNPLFNLVCLEQAGEDLEKNTKARNLLLYSTEAQPKITLDPLAVKQSTSKQLCLLIHSGQLLHLLQDKEQAQLIRNLDQVYLVGELRAEFEGLQFEHYQLFESEDELLGQTLATRNHKQNKNSQFVIQAHIEEYKLQTAKKLATSFDLPVSFHQEVFPPFPQESYFDVLLQGERQSGLILEFLQMKYLELLVIMREAVFPEFPDPENQAVLISSEDPRIHQKTMRSTKAAPAESTNFEFSKSLLLVHFYNFFRLGKTLEFYLGDVKDNSSNGNFDPAKVKQSYSHEFMEYLLEMKSKLSELKLCFRDSTLPEALRILDCKEEKFSDECSPEESLNTYFLRMLGILSDEAFVGPHTVHIDVTSQCNTKCTFCGYHTPLITEKPWAENGWDKLHLDYELFTHLIDDLEKIHTKEDILLTGGGEPLMHPRILDMIQYIKDRQMHIILFTNGMLLKKDTSHKLIDMGLDKIYWSIHAASSPTWVVQHPGSNEKTFPTVIENMRELIRYRKEKKSKGPKIVYVNVLSAVNVHEVMDMVDLAVDLGVDEVRFQVMHYGNEQTNHMMLSQHQIQELHSRIDEIEKRLKEGGVFLLDNLRFQIENLVDFSKKGKDVKSCDWAYNLYNNTGCFVGYFFTRTWVDGRMSFCCHDRVAGDLKDKSFKEHWFSNDYKNYRYVAKHFDDANNVDMYDGHKGGWLLANDCSWCGNYEYMNRAMQTMHRTGLGLYLEVGLNRLYLDQSGRSKDLTTSNVVVGEESFKPPEFLHFGGV